MAWYRNFNQAVMGWILAGILVLPVALAIWINNMWVKIVGSVFAFLFILIFGELTDLDEWLKLKRRMKTLRDIKNIY